MSDNNKNWGNDFSTHFNFHQPTFLDGIGSNLNIYGSQCSYNLHSDFMNLKNDWGTIGNDFKNTFDKLQSDPNSPLKDKF